MQNILIERSIQCPYCGESITILIDASVASQRYIEDCQICCRPIVLQVNIDINNVLSISAHSEDETF
ncbi:CPXCG motif-containing cysteine-rich protein [Microbulbifer sp. GL-2]|uniref:CPXCG motif-containing cysteine-rich protein n=1 Tax=Microbulbifer sp. GL-2 TaxID=2591606 RepID=UPI00117D4AA6|nr:CPXCG motif-containing cysteine-rich protein [Microbulbifer sp. GL-2]